MNAKISTQTKVELSGSELSKFDQIMEELATNPNHLARQATKDYLAKTGGWETDENGNIVFIEPKNKI